MRGFKRNMGFMPVQHQKPRIHVLRGNGQRLFAGQALCNDLRAVEFTMRPWYDEGRQPTCLRCLYAAGLYVPLSKLREHQDQQSGGRHKYGRSDPFYPHCGGCGRRMIDHYPMGYCPRPHTPC